MRARIRLRLPGLAALVAAMIIGGCDAPLDEPGLPHHDLGASGPTGDDPATADCEPGDPIRERHGTDCGCCHDDFGLVGSVHMDSGLERVRVEDATGFTLDIAVNPYGNFFRHVQLEPPLRAWVVSAEGETFAMMGPADGNCNACHASGSDLGLLGANMSKR